MQVAIRLIFKVAFNMPWMLNVDKTRGSYTSPPYPDPIPDPARILFARHILNQVASKYGLIDKGLPALSNSRFQKHPSVFNYV
jgi:hypothetical protein